MTKFCLLFMLYGNLPEKTLPDDSLDKYRFLFFFGKTETGPLFFYNFGALFE